MVSPTGMAVPTEVAADLWLAEAMKYNDEVYKITEKIQGLQAEDGRILDKLHQLRGMRERLIKGAEQCTEASMWYRLRGAPKKPRVDVGMEDISGPYGPVD